MTIKRLAAAYTSSIYSDGVLGTTELVATGSAAVAAFASTQPFSVAIAVKFPTDATGQFGIIGTTNGGTTGWEIITNSTGRDLRITLRGSSANDLNPVPNSNVVDGEWHEICFTATSTELVVYIDGQLRSISTGTWTGSAGEDLMVFDRGTVGVANAVGNAQDVRIFNKALTAQEVQNMFFDRVMPTNLVMHHKMNEATGTVAADSVGNFDMTLLSGHSWSGSTLK